MITSRMNLTRKYRSSLPQIARYFNVAEIIRYALLMRHSKTTEPAKSP